MKKTSALTALLILVAATATACSAGGEGGISNKEAKAWFSENCPLQTADVKETVVQGKPGGKTVGTAIVQGPIKPPAALSDSSQTIGLYTQDKLSGELQEHSELSVSDVFCMDPRLQNDPSRRITNPATQQSYTFLRSPKFPEGIWVGQDSSDLPRGFFVEATSVQTCEKEWWLATDLVNIDEAQPASFEQAEYEVSKPGNC